MKYYWCKNCEKPHAVGEKCSTDIAMQSVSNQLDADLAESADITWAAIERAAHFRK